MFMVTIAPLGFGFLSLVGLLLDLAIGYAVESVTTTPVLMFLLSVVVTGQAMPHSMIWEI